MPRAEADLDAIFLFIRASTAPLAERWFSGLLESIESLSREPFRAPPTPEDRALRQLVYGKKPHLYRVIFFVDETSKQVEVLHVRHHSSSSFTFDDLE